MNRVTGRLTVQPLDTNGTHCGGSVSIDGVEAHINPVIRDPKPSGYFMPPSELVAVELSCRAHPSIMKLVPGPGRHLDGLPIHRVTGRGCSAVPRVVPSWWPSWPRFLWRFAAHAVRLLDRLAPRMGSWVVELPRAQLLPPEGFSYDVVFRAHRDGEQPCMRYYPVRANDPDTTQSGETPSPAVGEVDSE